MLWDFQGILHYDGENVWPADHVVRPQLVHILPGILEGRAMEGNVEEITLLTMAAYKVHMGCLASRV